MGILADILKCYEDDEMSPRIDQAVGRLPMNMEYDKMVPAPKWS